MAPPRLRLRITDGACLYTALRRTGGSENAHVPPPGSNLATPRADAVASDE